MPITIESVFSDLQFVIDEFLNDPIEQGPLAGEFKPQIAIEKMLEIARYIKEVKQEMGIKND